MHYSVLTLFPQLLEPWLDEALIGRARAKGLIDISLHNLRYHAHNKHNTVDDYPYGGGAGMVIRVDVVARALQALREAFETIDAVILLSPAGRVFNQKLAEELSQKKNTFLCSVDAMKVLMQGLKTSSPMKSALVIMC